MKIGSAGTRQDLGRQNVNQKPVKAQVEKGQCSAAVEQNEDSWAWLRMRLNAPRDWPRSVLVEFELDRRAAV